MTKVIIIVASMPKTAQSGGYVLHGWYTADKRKDCRTFQPRDTANNNFTSRKQSGIMTLLEEVKLIPKTSFIALRVSDDIIKSIDVAQKAFLGK